MKCKESERMGEELESSNYELLLPFDQDETSARA